VIRLIRDIRVSSVINDIGLTGNRVIRVIRDIMIKVVAG
jgi:hypothetical protein